MIQDEYLHFCCTRCRSKKYVPRYAVIFCVNIDSYDHGNISHGHGSTKVGVLFKDHECHEPSIYIYIYIYGTGPGPAGPPPWSQNLRFAAFRMKTLNLQCFLHGGWLARSANLQIRRISATSLPQTCSLQCFGFDIVE